jgi:adenylyl-sulfate kinase
MVIWFTGMSGSGKSTLASNLLIYFEKIGKRVKTLDGDVIRSKKERYDFSKSNILKNNLTIIRLCADLLNDFDIILVSVIAPFESTRKKAREILGSQYFEIYVKANIDELIKRDTKGLYRKASNGEIKNLIGVAKNTPYETPRIPNIVIKTDRESVDNCVLKIIKAFEVYMSTIV